MERLSRPRHPHARAARPRFFYEVIKIRRKCTAYILTAAPGRTVNQRESNPLLPGPGVTEEIRGVPYLYLFIKRDIVRRFETISTRAQQL